VGNCEVGQVQEQDKEELIEVGREVTWTRREKRKSEDDDDAAMSSMSSLPLLTLERKENLMFLAI
jgi:hypothetical protein